MIKLPLSLHSQTQFGEKKPLFHSRNVRFFHNFVCEQKLLEWRFFMPTNDKKEDEIDKFLYEYFEPFKKVPEDFTKAIKEVFRKENGKAER